MQNQDVLLGKVKDDPKRRRWLNATNVKNVILNWIQSTDLMLVIRFSWNIAAS